MKLIRKIEGVKLDRPYYDTECVKCHNPIRLWFNGGELDNKYCCDVLYSLQQGRLDFVVEESE